MNDKLGAKNYAKFDRAYMAFGSIMNACQHIITEENKQAIIDWAWNNAKAKTSEFVDELYREINETERPA